MRGDGPVSSVRGRAVMVVEGGVVHGVESYDGLSLPLVVDALNVSEVRRAARAESSDDDLQHDSSRGSEPPQIPA